MTREQILALLKKLGVKIAEAGKEPVEGEFKEDDAVKLVEGDFNSVHLGLTQKRDELLAQEIKLKEKIKSLEDGATKSITEKAELEAQLKKNNPEEYKNYYEGKAKELEAKYLAEQKTLTEERDRFRDRHLARVRDDAIELACKDIVFADGLKNGFIALAMASNQFKPSEIDGKTVFTNQDNKTLGNVFHELKLSNEGKAYIKNQNAGGGSQGGQNAQASNPNNAAGGTNSMPRSQFMAMNDSAKMDFTSKGGQITDG